MEFYKSKIIKSEDIKVNSSKIIGKGKGTTPVTQVVTIEHIPTGIIVKGKSKTQLGAYKEAMLLLEKKVALTSPSKYLYYQDSKFSEGLYDGYKKGMKDLEVELKKKLENWIVSAVIISEAKINIGDLDKLEARAMRESGGDPRAVTVVPRLRGLMGLLDEAFNTYKIKNHDDIFNPVDNTIACINYLFSRYGEITEVDEEVEDKTSGVHTIKEDGAEIVLGNLAKFNQESVLSRKDADKVIADYQSQNNKKIIDEIIKDIEIKNSGIERYPNYSDLFKEERRVDSEAEHYNRDMLHKYTNDELIEELKSRLK